MVNRIEELITLYLEDVEVGLTLDCHYILQRIVVDVSVELESERKSFHRVLLDLDLREVSLKELFTGCQCVEKLRVVAVEGDRSVLSGDNEGQTILRKAALGGNE
jgi:hypothetical protein